MGLRDYEVASMEKRIAEAEERLQERARRRQEADRARAEALAYYERHRAANDRSGRP